MNYYYGTKTVSLDANRCSAEMTRAKLTLIVLMSPLTVGCTVEKFDESRHDQSKSTQSQAIELVFLTRDGCVNTPVLHQRLKDAVATFQPTIEFEILDQGTLFSGDPRTGYPTPTILLDNQDLFGLPEPTPPFPAPC